MLRPSRHRVLDACRVLEEALKDLQRLARERDAILMLDYASDNPGDVSIGRPVTWSLVVRCLTRFTAAETTKLRKDAAETLRTFVRVADDRGIRLRSTAKLLFEHVLAMLLNPTTVEVVASDYHQILAHLVATHAPVLVPGIIDDILTYVLPLMRQSEPRTPLMARLLADLVTHLPVDHASIAPRIAHLLGQILVPMLQDSSRVRSSVLTQVLATANQLILRHTAWNDPQAARAVWADAQALLLPCWSSADPNLRLQVVQFLRIAVRLHHKFLGEVYPIPGLDAWIRCCINSASSQRLLPGLMHLSRASGSAVDESTLELCCDLILAGHNEHLQLPAGSGVAAATFPSSSSTVSSPGSVSGPHRQDPSSVPSSPRDRPPKRPRYLAIPALVMAHAQHSANATWFRVLRVLLQRDPGFLAASQRSCLAALAVGVLDRVDPGRSSIGLRASALLLLAELATVFDASSWSCALRQIDSNSGSVAAAAMQALSRTITASPSAVADRIAAGDGAAILASLALSDPARCSVASLDLLFALVSSFDLLDSEARHRLLRYVFDGLAVRVSRVSWLDSDGDVNLVFTAARVVRVLAAPGHSSPDSDRQAVSLYHSFVEALEIPSTDRMLALLRCPLFPGGAASAAACKPQPSCRSRNLVSDAVHPELLRVLVDRIVAETSALRGRGTAVAGALVNVQDETTDHDNAGDDDPDDMLMTGSSGSEDDLMGLDAGRGARKRRRLNSAVDRLSGARVPTDGAKMQLLLPLLMWIRFASAVSGILPPVGGPLPQQLRSLLIRTINSSLQHVAQRIPGCCLADRARVMPVLVQAVSVYPDALTNETWGSMLAAASDELDACRPGAAAASISSPSSSTRHSRVFERTAGLRGSTGSSYKHVAEVSVGEDVTGGADNNGADDVDDDGFARVAVKRSDSTGGQSVAQKHGVATTDGRHERARRVASLALLGTMPISPLRLHAASLLENQVQECKQVSDLLAVAAAVLSLGLPEPLACLLARMQVLLGAAHASPRDAAPAVLQLLEHVLRLVLRPDPEPAVPPPLSSQASLAPSAGTPSVPVGTSSLSHHSPAAVREIINVCDRLLRGFALMLPACSSDRPRSGAASSKPTLGHTARLALARCMHTVLELDQMSRESLLWVAESFLPLAGDPDFLVRRYIASAVPVMFTLVDDERALFQDLLPHVQRCNTSRQGVLTCILALGAIAATSPVLQLHAVTQLCALAGGSSSRIQSGPATVVAARVATAAGYPDARAFLHANARPLLVAWLQHHRHGLEKFPVHLFGVASAPRVWYRSMAPVIVPVLVQQRDLDTLSHMAQVMQLSRRQLLDATFCHVLAEVWPQCLSPTPTAGEEWGRNPVDLETDLPGFLFNEYTADEIDAAIESNVQELVVTMWAACITWHEAKLRADAGEACEDDAEERLLRGASYQATLAGMRQLSHSFASQEDAATIPHFFSRSRFLYLKLVLQHFVCVFAHAVHPRRRMAVVATLADLIAAIQPLVSHPAVLRDLVHLCLRALRPDSPAELQRMTCRVLHTVLALCGQAPQLVLLHARQLLPALVATSITLVGRSSGGSAEGRGDGNLPADLDPALACLRYLLVELPSRPARLAIGRDALPFPPEFCQASDQHQNLARHCGAAYHSGGLIPAIVHVLSRPVASRATSRLVLQPSHLAAVENLYRCMQQSAVADTMAMLRRRSAAHTDAVLALLVVHLQLLARDAGDSGDQELQLLLCRCLGMLGPVDTDGGIVSGQHSHAGLIDWLRRCARAAGRRHGNLRRQLHGDGDGDGDGDDSDGGLADDNEDDEDDGAEGAVFVAAGTDGTSAITSLLAGPETVRPADPAVITDAVDAAQRASLVALYDVLVAVDVADAYCAAVCATRVLAALSRDATSSLLDSLPQHVRDCLLPYAGARMCEALAARASSVEDGQVGPRSVHLVGSQAAVVAASSQTGAEDLPLASAALWNPLAWASHDEWLSVLTTSLLSWPDIDGALAACARLTARRSDVALNLLPHALHNVLTSRTATTAAETIARHLHAELLEPVAQVGSAADSRLLRGVQTMLQALTFLKAQRRTSIDLALFGVLQLDLFTLAQAAHAASAHCSAQVYLETYLQERPITKESRDLLLRVAHDLPDPDALDGASIGMTLDQHAASLRLEHDGAWASALTVYDSMLQRGNQRAALSALSALRARGNHWLMSVAANHVAATGLAGAEEEAAVREVQAEAAWRAGNWDLLSSGGEDAAGGGQGFHSRLHASLRALVDGNRSVFHAGITAAQLETVAQFAPEGSRNQKRGLAQLQALHDVQHAWTLLWTPDGGRRALATAQVQDLVEQWHQRIHPSTEFQLIEPVIALQRTLLAALHRPDAVAQQWVHLAQLARAAGLHDQARAALQARQDADSGFGNAHLQDLQDVRWRVQYAHLLWDTGDAGQALGLARALCKRLHDTKMRLPRAVQLVDLLCLIGEWSGSVQDQPIDQTMREIKHAVVLGDKCGVGGKAYLTLARVADAVYDKTMRQLRSSEWQQVQALRLAKEAELQQCREQQRSARDQQAKRELKAHEARLQRQVSLDQAERQRVEKTRVSMLTTALGNYLTCLVRHGGDDDGGGAGSELQAVFRFVSLWLDNASDPDVLALLRSDLDSVPSHKFMPLLYQIASRLGTAAAGDTAVLVGDLLLRMAVDHPYHVLPQLLALSRGNQDVGKRYAADRDKVGAATSILKKLIRHASHDRRLRPLVHQMNKLWQAYQELANYDAKAARDTAQAKQPSVPVTKLPLPKSLLLVTMKSFEECPILTGPMPIDVTCGYTDRYLGGAGGRIVFLKTFKQHFTLAGGINLPRILECVGDDGRVYRQLVKGNDDLRQDAVMQQLFGLVNRLLDADAATSARQLRMRTYKVLPLTPNSGLLEWCEGTIPLGTYLTGPPRKEKAGAHARYHPHEPTSLSCRLDLTKADDASKVAVFQRICQQFTPVMHRFFLERFPVPHQWLLRRLTYTRSVACSSIVGYIVGLGDRHSQNILLDQATAEVVHIDLGVAFDQGKILRTPETIPFRLTRDVIDGMGVYGVEGAFRRSCEATLRVLRRDSNALLTILQVLLHDPLYKWALSTVKAMQLQSRDEPQSAYPPIVAAAVASVTSPPPAASSQALAAAAAAAAAGSVSAGNKEAQQVLLRLQDKLRGHDDGDTRSVEAQVRYLIETACNPKNLATLFPGWAPWL